MPDLLEREVVIEEDTLKDKFLTFCIGKEEYCLDIKFVTEIIGIQPITNVPELPEFVKGIINLRGKIIPVVDVRLRFGKDPREYDDRTCIIVVEIYDRLIGLIVDTVAEVLSIAENEISPPPQINTSYRHDFIKGIGKVGGSVKILLDCLSLFKEDDVYGMDTIS